LDQPRNLPLSRPICPSTSSNNVLRVVSSLIWRHKWFLSTKGVTASRDVRRHVDWILDKLAGKDEALRLLRQQGHRMDIFCYWLSADGHGGPIISRTMMQRLGELEIELGFDNNGPYDD
jgi:hypothetical protein